MGSRGGFGESFGGFGGFLAFEVFGALRIIKGF